MAFDLNSIYDSQAEMQNLIELYIQLEERPKIVLEEKKEKNIEKKNVLSDLDSKLSALGAKAERLSDPITNYFEIKNATSSDEDKFTVSATEDAELGSHSLNVEKLAASDTRVSNQYKNDDTDFSSFTSDQTFSITIGHPTDDDDYNRVSIEITVSADDLNQNNEDALYAIASAVNSAISLAKTASTANTLCRSVRH